MSNNAGGGNSEVQSASRPRVKQAGRKNLAYWIWAWLPVLLGVGVIALESTLWFGTDNTSVPFRRVFEALFGAISDSAWQEIHHIIRKCGHFFGYGIIGLAWLRAWWMTLPRTRYIQNGLLSLLGTGLLASWDEWHQFFLPNRTSSTWDVLIDCCGAITLCLIACLFVRFFHPKRMARS